MRGIVKLQKRYGECVDEAEKKELLKQIHKLEVEKRRLPYKDASDKKIAYVRYADDFIIGVSGSREDAERIKQELTLFVATRLKLELSDEKTKSRTVPAMLIFSDMTSTCADVRNPKGKPMGFYSGRLITLWNCLFPWSGLRSSCTTVRLSFKVRTANSSHGKETQWRVLLTLKL